MADPLSVTSNAVVARTATSAAALVSTLYDIIVDTHDPSPPRDMKDVAGGVRDLSNGLRDLYNLLQKIDRAVFRSDLFASIHSISEHIEVLIERIRGLVKLDDIGDGNGGDTRRVSCASWNVKTDGIVLKIESLKLVVGLVLSMMSLVSEQDKRTTWRDESEHLDEEDERLFLREQVEILVRATKQAMKDASSPTLTCRDVGTQTGNPRPLSYTTNSADASPTNTEQPYPGASEEPYCSKERHSTRIERFRHVPEEDNTARWLYRIVFGEVATTPCLNYGDDDGGLHMQSVPPVRRLASECSKISGTEVMDSLLRSWSRLNEDEIQELRTLPCSASADEKNATATTIRIHGHSHSLMRASVHQMVSKALSYAHPNDTNESAHDGGKSDAQLSSRRRTSQDGSSDLVMHAAHSPNEADPKNFGEDERHGETPQNRESSRSSGLPPLPPPQHTSRHRHRPASWVLGPHRAQNRSSERREGHAAPSSLSSRSRFIGWRSQQARRPPEKPGVGLSSPTSSSSLSSSTSDGDKCARLPSRSSQQSPLPKVLFTSPVARLGSASSCTTGNTNNTTATATTATTKATTTTTRRHSSPAQPTKGILKTPTHHFPEEPNPIREGVAPHKFDKSKSDAPPGAKWTKIKRSWVNPEALTIGKERFEVVGNHYVKVLRVLSREEIEAYRIATAQLRAMREGGPPGGGGA